MHGAASLGVRYLGSWCPRDSAATFVFSYAQLADRTTTDAVGHVDGRSRRNAAAGYWAQTAYTRTWPSALEAACQPTGWSLPLASGQLPVRESPAPGCAP